MNVSFSLFRILPYCFLTLCFICVFRDLSGHNEIQTVILDSFSSHNEEVKAAASYALGICLSFSVFFFVSL